MRPLSTTSYALLGLLSFARMSGYDLAAASQRSIAHFWPISKTQVYAELRRLDERGLAAGSRAATSGGPAKTVYELTPAGEEALDAWLAEPSLDGTRLRAPALLKLLLGHRTGAGTAREHLRAYRDAASRRRVAVAALAGRLEENPDAVYAWATALFGLRISEAIVAWADEVLGALPDRAVHVDPRRRTPAKARALLDSLE
jgi:DNA-binding PadR family transcriptional regulator